jgi:sugar lactone lactonase YvrE
MSKNYVAKSIQWSSIQLLALSFACSCSVSPPIQSPEQLKSETGQQKLQNSEKIRVVYQHKPQRFNTQNVDLNALKYLRISVQAEASTESYGQSETEFTPINPNGATEMEVINIPQVPGRLRVVTVQGYDADKQLLTAFTAKGIYRSSADKVDFEVQVDRRQLLSGLLIERLFKQAGFQGNTLNIDDLQSQIDQITGFDSQAQKFTKDPLLFNPDTLESLWEQNNLNPQGVQDAGAGQGVNTSLFIATPQGCNFDQELKLSIDAPGVADILIPANTSAPSTNAVTLPLGTWTLRSSAGGNTLNSTRIVVGANGLVNTSPASSKAAAWNAYPANPIQYYLAEKVAGGGVGDGYAAIDAYIQSPKGMALMDDGSLIVSDYRRIRRIKTDGKIETFAGTGEKGYAGDGGALNAAQLSPIDLVRDPQGNIYFSDIAHVIRKITPQGTLSTIAGTGQAGFSGDGGPAIAAQLDEPHGLHWHNNALYIADRKNRRIRRINADGSIETVAGNGEIALSSSGPALNTSIGTPWDVYVASDGTLYIGDGTYSRVLKVDNGQLSTWVGNGAPTMNAPIPSPTDMQFDNQGRFHFIASNQLYRIDNEQLVLVSGNQGPRQDTAMKGLLGDGGPATNAFLRTAQKFLQLPTGEFLIADTGHKRIAKVDHQGIQTTFAGLAVGDNGPATNAFLDYPNDLNFDAQGNLLIADGRYRLRRVDKDTGIINTLAGNGFRDLSGDDGPAVNARIDAIFDIFGLPDNRIFLASSWNRRFRQIDAQGIMSTQSLFHYPVKMSYDGQGNFYVTDFERHQVYRYNLQNKTSTLIAGTGAEQAGSPDGITATSAPLFRPWGIHYEASTQQILVGSVGGDYRIRSIDAQTGIISTLAGNGQKPPNDWHGTLGDGGPARDAYIEGTVSITSDTCGNVFFNSGGRIRRVDRQRQTINSVVGLANNTRLSNGQNWDEELEIKELELRPDGTFYALVDKRFSESASSYSFEHTVYKFTPQYANP